MLKERLKDMDIRITELAEYLQVSRPTMYKFIDYYEEHSFDLINKKVLKPKMRIRRWQGFFCNRF